MHLEKLNFGIIVISDKIYKGERVDESGKICLNMLTENNLKADFYVVVPNDENLIEESIKKCFDKARICITIGGTGPSQRDLTIEVANKLSTKLLPGFGELFRKITFERQGASKAITTRTELFLINDKVLLCLPGSPSAVRLGTELFLEVIGHLVEELSRINQPHRDF